MDLSAQWQYLEDIAALRLAHNKTSRHVSQYGTYIELIGAAGELAARRFLGLPEELHQYLDGGTDMCYRGIRIDVKATGWNPKLQFKYLQWPISKVVKADVILLTAIHIANKAAIVVGYALRHEILRAPVNQARDFPCHELPVPSLRKASQLLFVESRNDLFPYETYPRGGYGSHTQSPAA